jgi:phosphoglycolate phosphatase-like HAD superfamily hydrolase
MSKPKPEIEKPMAKPIIATTLSGLFIKSEPWKKAHILWFERAARELNDVSVKKYASAREYFQYVDKVMERLYPGLPDKERTVKARELFFDAVYEYLSKKPELINKDIIEYFPSLKDNYRLALITTNIKPSLEKILALPDLKGLFDIVEASHIYEKDDKAVVFDRFIEKYGKPKVYIGGDREDSFLYCEKQRIQCVFANLEGAEDVDNVYSAHTFEDLKKRIKMVLK